MRRLVYRSLQTSEKKLSDPCYAGFIRTLETHWTTYDMEKNLHPRRVSPTIVIIYITVDINVPLLVGRRSPKQRTPQTPNWLIAIAIPLSTRP